MIKHGMGWLPDYPDFRDYTEETEEIKTILKSSKSAKSGQAIPKIINLKNYNYEYGKIQKT